MSSSDYSALGFKDIVLSLDGSVAVISLNRPKHRNSINKNIIEELIQAFNLFDKDDRVRVVILTADPSAPAFCSGADISGGWDLLWDAEAEKEGDHAHRDSGGTLSVVIYRCRKITIAAVNGHAAGAGITAFQLPFDFRFVWAGAKLTFPFVRRGISAEATSTYLLPRLLGHSRASALLLTGATVTPESNLIQDLYYQIIPTREEVFPVAKAFAKELAANTSQPSVTYTKALLQHPGDSIEENHLLDSRAIRILGRSNDAVEGVNSFKERRSPMFTDTLSSRSDPWFPWWRSWDITHRKSKL
ncbi:putative enoyl- hydratase isomerase family protein [Lyophyllum shimeji]|uniref:Enoyl- hydratase isomerase family protein n=1 Tax=Lyophyllum shimeji TaxID=47721 RepID=A0A9P3UK88_LYOSH|nr:putative enoyl- hydratase isomerase family protein [Lyophyllum shimeji]